MNGSRIAAGGVLLAAALLIFVGLGDRLLWVDEAETALLARSTLHHGIPKALDGKNLISQEAGKEYDARYVWRWTPWLDKYVAASSFLVAGEGTVSARFPFALAGLLSVAALYPFAGSMFRDRRVAVLSMAFLTCSVPFLLHVRQCRYYSLAILGFLGAAHFLGGIVAGRKRALWGFAAAMTVLFHSNYMTFVAAGVALGIGFLVLGPSRAAFRRLALAGAVVAVVNLPWAIFFDVLGKSADAGRITSFAQNLRTYGELTLRYSFPALALAGFAALLASRRARATLILAPDLRPLLYLVTVPAIYLVVISAGPWSFYRYTVNLLPLFSVLLAFLCVRLFTWNRLAGIAVTVCLLCTGLAYEASAWPLLRTTPPAGGNGRSFAALDRFFPLGNFLYERAHPFQDATEAIVDHLSHHAKEGERVFLSYGDLVVRFYTGLEVRGGMSGQSLADWPAPEWIVVRRFFRFADRPHLKEDAERMAAWLKGSVPWDRYGEVVLAPPDLPWESIPEPHLHWFRAPTQGEPVRIFRQVSAGRS